MKDQKILIKEICHKTSFSSQFEGSIVSQIPPKEIYELKHEIKSPRILIGKKVIACLGEILVKAYCVGKDSNELFMVEHCFRYRNFLTGDYPFYNLQPHINIKSDLQGLVVESIEENNIQMTGILAIQLVFSLEKEYNLSALQEFSASIESQDSVEKLSEGRENFGMRETLDALSLQEYTTNINFEEHYEEKISGEEIPTEVIQGVNQDITIILD